MRSTPDLIAPPYNVFDSNVEVQFCYMCVGRGVYQLHNTITDAGGSDLTTPVWDIKDDLTPISEEAGSSVEVYFPYTSPNSFLLPPGATAYVPQLTIGDAIGEPVWQIQSSSSVVGQILRPPNDQSVTGNSSIYADQYGVMHCNGANSEGGSSIDFTAYFVVGDMITSNFTNAEDPGGHVGDLDLSGTYECLDVQTDSITFANPAAVNPNWNDLVNFTGGESKAQSVTLSCNGPKWVGPFILNYPAMTQVWCNFVAPQGLFKVSSSSGNQYETDIEVQIGIQAIDGNNNPVGTEVFFYGTCYGSAILQSQRALTVKCVLPLPGSCQVRVVRVNTTDNTWQGTNADQLQWRDLYAVSPPLTTDYGNVTTVLTKTVATASALTTKERKLNMLVTRCLPVLDPVTHEQVPAFAFNMNVTSTTVVSPNDFDVSLSFSGLASDPAPTGTISLYSTTGNVNSLSTVEHTGPFVFGTAYAVAVASTVGTTVLHFVYSGDANYPSLKVSVECVATAVGSTPVVTPFTWTNRTFSNFAPSDNAADIIVAMALDPWIGMRTPAELNWDNIYALAGAGGTIEMYFGTDLCTQFGYTFDDSNVSFEESLSDVAQAIFCTAFRRGSVLDISFEEPTDVGTILFNHRNKIPGSETRTVLFGLTNDYDGIELDYIDPAAPNYPDLDTTVTLYYPTDQSALSAKKIKLIGVRNNVQAALIGWRLYQKLLYQNTSVEFKSTKEAADCVLNDNILVADDTRDDVVDGQVVAVNGLQLTLSQPVPFPPCTGFVPDGSYYIFLQLSTGVIEAIACTTYPSLGDNVVILENAPSTPLNTDPSTWAQTTYIIAAPQFLPQTTGVLCNLPFTSILSTGTITGTVICAPPTPQATGKLQMFMDGLSMGDPFAVPSGNEYAINVPCPAIGVHEFVVTYSGDAVRLAGKYTFTITVTATPPDPSISTAVSITSQTVPVLNPAAQRTAQMLLSEKKPEDKQLYTLKAVNYDARYYAHDLDFINGVLTENGTDYNGNGGYPAPTGGSNSTHSGSASGNSHSGASTGPSNGDPSDPRSDSGRSG